MKPRSSDSFRWTPRKPGRSPVWTIRRGRDSRSRRMIQKSSTAALLVTSAIFGWSKTRSEPLPFFSRVDIDGRRGYLDEDRSRLFPLDERFRAVVARKRHEDGKQISVEERRNSKRPVPIVRRDHRNLRVSKRGDHPRDVPGLDEGLVARQEQDGADRMVAVETCDSRRNRRAHSISPSGVQHGNGA